MAKRKGNLLRQVTLSLGLAIIFLSLASFYYQYQTERHILTQSIRSDLRRQANLLRAWLSQARGDAGERRKIAEQYVETIKHLNETSQNIVIVDHERKVVASSTGDTPGDVFPNEMLREAIAADALSEGACLEVSGACTVVMPFYTDATHETVAGGILLKRPLTAVDTLAGSLMLGTFILLVVTLVIIVIVIHVVLRMKVHKPMQAIFMQEYRIREGDLAKIEAEDPNNEFSDLYAMYNEMVMRIAAQKKAILGQKDHVALAGLVRQAVTRLTGPLDEIITESRTLLEHESSLSEDDRKILRQIIGNITRIARELKSMVVEGDKSAGLLRDEADKIRQYDEGETKDEHSRHVIE